jgi:inner membrane protein YidH
VRAYLRRSRVVVKPSEPAPAASAALFNVQTHFGWIRTSLSAERTLMAWNRTSLSLIAFGFTIYQFFTKFQEATVGPSAAHPQAPRNLGLALIVLGTAGTLIALWQYWRLRHYLEREEFAPNGMRDGLPVWSLSFAVAVFSAVIGLVTTASIALAG